MNERYESIYCSLHDYVTAELEGSATPQQRAEFTQLMQNDQAARQIYVAYMQELASLRWSYAVHPADVFAAIERDGDIRPDGGVDGQVPRSNLRELAVAPRRDSSRAARYALAAVLIVGLGWAALNWRVPGDRPRQLVSNDVVGQIVDLANVQWADGAKRYQAWSRYAVGDVLRFDSGVIDLTLSNGVEIELKGPADFQLVSAKKAIMRRGKLVARCGPDAVGFEVESPDAKVVDLGTAFGVSVVDGVHTEVAVYDGAVDISARVGTAPVARRLTAGEALHVNRRGEIGRIPVVSDDRLLMPRDLLNRGEGHSELIRSVRDNLQTSQIKKFYRIIGRGFGEDCPAFVDRDHQWNGLDESGIPPFLVGGDYVMTFNDDKIRRIEVEVELAKPATMYVLLDDRVAPPSWLHHDFVDTGWDLGLDESYDDRELVKSGVGAGKSIDQVFSIWRRDFSAPTTVRLGYIRPEDIDVNPRKVLECMYGVVVTELVKERTLRSP